MVDSPNAGNQAMLQVAQQILVAIGSLNQTLSKTLPVVQTTAAGNTNSVWTGYLNITLPNGAAAKVPYV